jgi:hypothetical protein
MLTPLEQADYWLNLYKVACAELTAAHAENARLSEENEHITDVAKRDGLQAIAQYGLAQKANAELAAMHQQRDTLYSALQWIASGMAGERQDIKDYANYVLDTIDCEGGRMTRPYEYYVNPITQSRMERFEQFYESLDPDEKKLLDHKLNRWCEASKNHAGILMRGIGEKGARELFMALMELEDKKIVKRRQDAI